MFHCTHSRTEVHAPKHLYCPLPGTHHVHGGRSLANWVRSWTLRARTQTPLPSTTGIKLRVWGPENSKATSLFTGTSHPGLLFTIR